jgi:hypothetical protein
VFTNALGVSNLYDLIKRWGMQSPMQNEWEGVRYKDALIFRGHSWRMWALDLFLIEEIKASIGR